MKSLSFSNQNQIQEPILYQGLSGIDLVNRLTSAGRNADSLLSVLFDFFSINTLNFHDFEFSKGSYSRTILLREKSGFEIMIAHWDMGARTPIHGHPDFSLFYVIAGRLKETLFTRNQNQVNEELTTIHTPGDYTYHHGIENRFDNSIHRISALEESLSLHIYSDDALKGEIF